jgi:N-acyl-L-homoserine lactone synthetase
MVMQNDFNLYFKVADTEKELKACQSIRYKVYCEERKWLPADHYPDQLESDIYDEKSPTFIALDDDFNIVGLMRFIKGGDYGTLPFLDHPAIKTKGVDVRTMGELSRYIIVAPKNRGLVSHGIFRICHHYGKRYGITDYVILIEPSLRRLIERFYWFYEPMCPPAMYYGAFTYPAVCNSRQIEKTWYKKYPENYRFYMDRSNVISSVEMVKG